MKSRKLKAELTYETHMLIDWVICADILMRCPLCEKAGRARVFTDELVHGRFHALHGEALRHSREERALPLREELDIESGAISENL